MKFEVFERLNTGGIALNAQELRNSLYRGKLNNRLKAIVKNKHFRICIGTKNPRRRMVDEELVLRWFAMYDGLKDYRPSLKKFLIGANKSEKKFPNFLFTHLNPLSNALDTISDTEEKGLLIISNKAEASFFRAPLNCLSNE